MIEVEKIFYNGLVSTLDPKNKNSHAIAVSGDRILQVGTDKEILALKTNSTKLIDLKKRRVVPGLIDSHTHLIRGGLNYNMELRWDGLDSLTVGLKMLKAQAERTPAPQWVRVVGGFTAHQFKEKRLPTIEELNEAAPDTPVFILHLYDRALLNRAAVQVCGFTKDTPNPPGGEIIRDTSGNPTGCLVAKPSAVILYSTLAKGPTLPFEYQLNSTRHFMRELNRLGVTGVIDAGGGSQNFPDDYEVIDKLSKQNELTVSVPSWVRGRAASIYLLIFYGGMSLGAAFWGYISSEINTPSSLTVAASTLFMGTLFAKKFKLPQTEKLDLSPSGRWAEPTVIREFNPNDHAVVVTVEYQIDPSQKDAFKAAMQELKEIRQRDGAFSWQLTEDVADPGRYIEIFYVESWAEHLHQHQRGTNEDIKIESTAKGFHIKSELPKVTHLLVSKWN